MTMTDSCMRCKANLDDRDFESRGLRSMSVWLMNVKFTDRLNDVLYSCTRIYLHACSVLSY